MVNGVMEALKLSEQDQRYYAELFSSCDVENTGRVTGVKASELFLTSGLPQEVLLQISDICGAKRLGHFGRSQFYIALKLIAAAQCGLPVAPESLSTGVELPTPKFIRQFDADGRRPQVIQTYSQHIPTEQEFYTDRNINQGGLNQINQQTGGLPPPPHSKRTGRVLPGSLPGQDSIQNNIRDSPNDTRSPPFSPNVAKDSPPLSPGVQQQPVAPIKMDVIGKQVSAPAAVVMTNRYGDGAYPNNQFEVSPQKMEKGWASFEEDHQGLLSEETKETQWAHFSDANKGDTSSISSEAESIEDVWSITDEQREYYINQFGTMQPDMAGKITGPVAKEFFEKSKLPVTELSKIWNLADINRDGMLSLDEFCIAMHLVVLRRNEIPLPEKIPPALMPYVQLVNVNPEEPFAADLQPGHTNLQRPPTPPSPQPPAQQWTTNFPINESNNASSATSSVSSPGNKPTPVNFEFKPVSEDPESKILHPVAMRLSPDGVPINDDNKPRTFSDIGVFSNINEGASLEIPPRRKERSYTASVVLDVGAPPVIPKKKKVPTATLR